MDGLLGSGGSWRQALAGVEQNLKEELQADLMCT